MVTQVKLYSLVCGEEVVLSLKIQPPSLRVDVHKGIPTKDLEEYGNISQPDV